MQNPFYREIQMNIWRPLALLSAFLLSPPVLAEGMTIEPGMWEMKSTMKMPMLPEPRVTTLTECMTESEISMDDLSGSDLDPACKFQVEQAGENSMKWTVDCPVEGGSSHGEWSATSNGDSVNGDGVITMSFQGQSMEMTMEWSGRRTGPCP
jgi:hypothetical protein